MHLSNLGNRAAAKRLAEIDMMCSSLTLETEMPDVDIAQPEMLMQPFSLYLESQPAPSDVARAPNGQGDSAQNMTDENVLEGQDAATAAVEDLGDIILEGEDDLYWIYHNPSLSLTGVEQADWELLENQLV